MKRLKYLIKVFIISIILNLTMYYFIFTSLTPVIYLFVLGASICNTYMFSNKAL